MRKFVMSDIHGHVDAARALLEHVEIDMSKDSLRFLGDYIDRGPNSYECIKLVQKYQRQGATAHMGNHELMLLSWASGNLDSHMFYMNGGEATVKSLAKGASQEEYEQILHWITTLKVTDEDDEYFYVHAGIHPHKMLSNQDRNDFLWIREEFLTARPEWLAQQVDSKIIVHGHTPMHNVCFDGVKINTDVGAGGARKLALVELTERVVYEYSFWDLQHFGPDNCISKTKIEDRIPEQLYKG